MESLCHSLSKVMTFFSSPVKGESISSSPELNLSDGNIRYYEYEGDSLHYLAEYKSSEPRRSSLTLVLSSPLLIIGRKRNDPTAPASAGSLTE